MKTNFLLLAFLALVLASCGPKIYKSADFATVASKHKVVAIIPAAVAIQLRPNQAKKTSMEELEKTEASTGYTVQEKLYGYFLRRSSRHQYSVEFQDVSQTNALLSAAHLGYKDLQTRSKAELAKILGVDAVISTSVRTDKPMSDGAAIAVGILVGAWGNTNKAFTTINIHEGVKGNLMWQYDYEASGSVGSSPEKLVGALMKNASKKFPYNKG